MIVTMYMCAPKGEALRQQWVDALNALKRDNRYVIGAMLKAGQDVPDTVVDAGLDYEPERHEWTPSGEPSQVFYGMKAMFEKGTFSCGDAAAYEASVAEEKYGVPTECLAVPTTDEDNLHGIFVTPMEAVDPTENWLQHWEYLLGSRDAAPVLPRHLTSSATATIRQAGAGCSIVDGRVVCDVEDSDASCCVDLDRGVWRCPDPGLNGKPVQIAEVFQGDTTGQRWARTKQGVFVPVCKSKPTLPTAGKVLLGNPKSKRGMRSVRR